MCPVCEILGLHQTKRRVSESSKSIATWAFRFRELIVEWRRIIPVVFDFGEGARSKANAVDRVFFARSRGGAFIEAHRNCGAKFFF